MRSARFTISFLVAAAVLAVPGLASAKQSFMITSASGTFPAGGHPTYTTTIGLDSTSAGTPSSLAIHLMPGVLASPAANPSCVTTATPDSSACEIGTGSVSVLGLPGAPLVKAYLVPPPKPSDIVGIDLVSGGLLPIHAGAKLVQTASGNVQTVLSVPLTSLGPAAGLISSMSLTINGTLNHKPFNRMPTNCSPGHSTLTVVYASKKETSTAAPDFKPTGCKALPFAPKFSATARESAHQVGTAVTTTVTQATDEAATSALTLTLPHETLSANIQAVKLQNTTTPVGSAVAASPLLPKPLKGKIYLIGTPTKSKLKIRFPAPAKLTLTGVVSLANDSVTIPAVPDVPLTNLLVKFPGGQHSLLFGNCLAPKGPVKAAFTSQNGKTVTDRRPLKLAGCPAH
jgi:hypothetical protein